jgi:predicted chitinase
MRREYFTHDQIARILGVPIENVDRFWPHIEYVLEHLGIYNWETVIVALATVKVEVGNFAPIHEYGDTAYFTRMYEGRADLGNIYPGDGARYHGRGFIQLTGRANYRTYGQLMGFDLEGNPDMALDPSISAWVLGLYFVRRGISAMAQRHDWRATRIAVNGGLNGWADYISYITTLVYEPTIPEEPAAPEPQPEPPSSNHTLAAAVAYGMTRIGDRYVWDGEQPGGFDCSGFVSWALAQAGKTLTSYTDAQFNETEHVDQPRFGDLIFYHYPDSQAAYWKHVGFWLGNGKTLESRHPNGVGIYDPIPNVVTAFRRIPGIEIGDIPDDFEVEDPMRIKELEEQLARKQEELDALVNVVGYLTGDIAVTLDHAVDALEEAAKSMRHVTDELRRHKLS